MSLPTSGAMICTMWWITVRDKILVCALSSFLVMEVLHACNFRTVCYFVVLLALFCVKCCTVNRLFLRQVLGALLHSIDIYMTWFCLINIYLIYFFCFLDQKFLISLEFLWKVVVITLVSCLPLYILKYLRRKYAPPSYSKLTN